MATPAQINQRSRAATKRHASGSLDEHMATVVRIDADEDQSINERMAEYRAMVGDPISWADCKTLEQVRYEIYKTRLAARDDAKARGELIPLEQVRARDEAKAAIYRRAMAGVNDLLAQWVAPDRILAAQAAARVWVDQTLERVADEVAG